MPSRLPAPQTAAAATLTMMCLIVATPRHVSAADPAQAISPEAQQLVQQLSAADVFDRQMAFMRLEALREPATAGVVRQYLTDQNTETRSFSVRALAAIEGPASIPTLVEMLRSDHEQTVRLAALLAIEPFDDARVVTELIAALRDRHPYVRMAAVDAVSRIDHPWAKEAIFTRWRREGNRDVRRVLQMALKRIRNGA